MAFKLCNYLLENRIYQNAFRHQSPLFLGHTVYHFPECIITGKIKFGARAIPEWYYQERCSEIWNRHDLVVSDMLSWFLVERLSRKTGCFMEIIWKFLWYFINSQPRFCYFFFYYFCFVFVLFCFLFCFVFCSTNNFNQYYHKRCIRYLKNTNRINVLNVCFFSVHRILRIS